MEEHTEKDKDLEKPVFVNRVEKNPDLAPGEGCQDVHCDEDRHPQPADAMQDESQHGTLPSVAQAGSQADIPVQTHLRLLKGWFWKKRICPVAFLEGDNAHGVFVSDFL